MCTGGLSSLTLGMRYPSQFAAIGIFSPITNLNETAKSIFNDSSDAVDVWLAQNTPLRFTNNYLNLPLYILHGYKAEVPEKQSFDFVANCNKYKIFPYFKITFDDKNPEITSTNYTVFDFLKEKKRIKNPEIIDFSTYQLKYNNAYWVTIERLISFSERAKLHAEITGNNFITIETKNIAEISLQPSDLIIDRTKPLKVLINGKILFNQCRKENKISINIIQLQMNKLLYKSHSVEGPIMHAFSSGFILADCENVVNPLKMSAPCDSIYGASQEIILSMDVVIKRQSI